MEQNRSNGSSGAQHNLYLSLFPTIRGNANLRLALSGKQRPLDIKCRCHMIDIRLYGIQ